MWGLTGRGPRGKVTLSSPGRSGRPTFFTAVFSTFTPAIKESWISTLQMAKLALGKTGHQLAPRAA